MQGFALFYHPLENQCHLPELTMTPTPLNRLDRIEVLAEHNTKQLLYCLLSIPDSVPGDSPIF